MKSEIWLDTGSERKKKNPAGVLYRTPNPWPPLVSLPVEMIG